MSCAKRRARRPIGAAAGYQLAIDSGHPDEAPTAATLPSSSLQEAHPTECRPWCYPTRCKTTDTDVQHIRRMISPISHHG